MTLKKWYVIIYYIRIREKKSVGIASGTNCAMGGHMTTKEKLLELFEANKGIYFSGEELAENFAVSRGAVWKAVKSLRSAGYALDAVTNKGYCLSPETDILSPQGIRKYLNAQNQRLDLAVLPTVTSTNAVVRELVDKGQIMATRRIEDVLIANEQTKGRGRRGREFYSPEGTGIYMSLLLKADNYSTRQATRFTTMAAVAMCEAIEEVSEEKAQIKWVNDIFIREKKVCGILTEAFFDLESGGLDYVILGAGVNVYPPKEGFPGELAKTAGYLFEDKRSDGKNRLAAAFLNYFTAYYQAEDILDYTEKYRKRSLAMNRQVTVISGKQIRRAFVCGIDEECRLIVRYDNEEMEHLSYGEIQIQF